MFEEAWDFIKGHPVAMAILPAVAALYLIPGVGEIVDAAEFATLSTEAVESTGLVIEGMTTLEVEEGAVGVDEGTTTVKEGLTAGNRGVNVPQPKEELDLPNVPTHEPGASVEEQVENLPNVPTDEIGLPEKVPSGKTALKERKHLS